MSMSTNDALRVTSELVGQRLRGHDSELEKLAAQTAAHEVRLAVLEAKPSTAGPINEAGITATFAAIFAALDSLLDRVATLESARIAAPTAPESTETGPGVPMEPGNATGYYSGAFDVDSDDESQLRRMIWADDPEVAAALRMYQKVQGCKVEGGTNGFVQTGARPDSGTWDAFRLLAWLKEGEAQ